MRNDITVTVGKGLDPSKNSRDGRTPFGAQAPVLYKVNVNLKINGRTSLGITPPVPFKTPHFPSFVPPSGLVLSNKKDGIVKTVPLCTILIFHYDCDCSGGFCG